MTVSKRTRGVDISFEPHAVFWECRQVNNSIAPSAIIEGKRLQFCEHALRQFRRSEMPKTSRFFTGTVTMVWSGIMRIAFDKGQDGAPISISCGIKECARFCIPIEATRMTTKRALRDVTKAAKNRLRKGDER